MHHFRTSHETRFKPRGSYQISKILSSNERRADFFYLNLIEVDNESLSTTYYLLNNHNDAEKKKSKSG